MKDQSTLLGKKSLKAFFFILLLSLSLSACGIGTAESDITVYRDKYQLDTVISVSSDQMEMIGGPEVFEEALNDAVIEAQGEGLTLKWRDITERNSGTYQYKLSTGRIDITDPYLDNFSWEETRFNNRTAYEFRYSPFAGFMSGFQSQTITLHAGRILDSNGTQIDDRTVTWANPSMMPYAIVTPKGSASWVFILLSIAIVAAAGYILYKLIKSGKLTKWATTGVNVGKWKIQETKLNSEIKSLEQDKENLVAELGEKTWGSRIKDLSYAEPYEHLETLDQQASQLDREIKDLDSNLQETNNTYNQLKTEYSEKIDQLKNEHKIADENLNTYRKNQDNLEKQVSKITKEKDKLEDEIRDYEEKLAEIQISDDEDKEEKAYSLNSAISSLNKNLLDINNQMPEIQSEISKLQVEQQPLIDKITDINDRITQAQADKKAALEPLEQQISDLEKKIKESKKAFINLKDEMKPFINKLGPLANSARPESEVLNPLYGRIDAKDSELSTKSEEHNLLKTRLEARDKGSLRNLLLTIAGIIVAIILLVVFLVAAF